MGTVPSYRTWVAGEIVTAAFMNSNIRDGGNFGIAVPFAELRQATVQSIPNNAFTAITMDASDVDSDGGHSNVTNNSRYTGKTPGWFQFSGMFSISVNATNARACEWLKNGTALLAGGGGFFAGAGGQANWVVARTKHIQLNGTTDFVELAGFQNSGGALNTVTGTGGDPSGMAVRWVHT